MEINVSNHILDTDPIASDFVTFIRESEESLDLVESQVYYDFLIGKDLDEEVIIAKILIISRRHGAILVDISSARSSHELEEFRQEIRERNDNRSSLLYSRLLRNKALRAGSNKLAFNWNISLYVPNVDGLNEIEIPEIRILQTRRNVLDFFNENRGDPIDESVYAELVATIEGAKGLIKPKARPVNPEDHSSKGYLANLVESEISRFDQRQKHGYMNAAEGLQRIRGLAGSGKTVVLAMKAALTHLKYPEAPILYTFYTKSLYQHVIRLITRFYRQYDDKDPEWSKLRVLHAWGGYSNNGVLYDASINHGIEPISFTEAQKINRAEPFGYACSRLLEKADIHPLYDYVFVDEGQDFPSSFIQLCIKLTRNNRLAFAYDDLQTIFQPSTPSMADIVGRTEAGRPRVELTEDVVLYKCYRNPREILVCAHAVGFGIYGKIVQMLENREQWEDIGYKVVDGEFTEGSETIIERPEENSLGTISNNQDRGEIVEARKFETFDEEVNEVVRSIRGDLESGLRPDDILVAVVDDRNASAYLNKLVELLEVHGIHCHNTHADKYGIKDFSREGFVTLSTVHKAKGNEAFIVYVVGVDALFVPFTSVRERNILFTAMTRAKGWVRVFGVGSGAALCKAEIDQALENFPNLRFNYPSEEELRILKRDLAEGAIKKQQIERQLDKIFEQMSEDEVERYFEQKHIKKG